MKNVFALACLLPAVAFALVLAAQFAGRFRFDVMNLPVILGWFTASGVLALAVADFRRRPTYDAPARPDPAKVETNVRPGAGTFATWGYKTLSA